MTTTPHSKSPTTNAKDLGDQVAECMAANREGRQPAAWALAPLDAAAAPSVETSGAAESQTAIAERLSQQLKAARASSADPKPTTSGSYGYEY